MLHLKGVCGKLGFPVYVHRSPNSENLLRKTYQSPKSHFHSLININTTSGTCVYQKYKFIFLSIRLNYLWTVIRLSNYKGKPCILLFVRSIKEGAIAEGPIHTHSLCKKFSSIHSSDCSLCFLKTLILNKRIPLLKKKFQVNSLGGKLSKNFCRKTKYQSYHQKDNYQNK